MNGRLILDNKELFEHHLRALEGKRVEIIVREPISPAQRGYYFSTILPAAAVAMGQDRLTTHCDLKAYIKQIGILDWRTSRVIEMPGESFETVGRESFGHILAELKLLVRDWLGGDID